MIKTNLLNETGLHKVIDQNGKFSVVEYDKDVSVSPQDAAIAYFASEMNVKKRQVIATLDSNGVIIQAGAMQIMAGSIEAATNIKGAGDLLKKAVSAAVTKETVIKPKYSGTGQIVLEPTFRYVILQDMDDWNGSMVIEDGLFLACDDTVDITVTARSTFSSAILGGEGLFNSSLKGKGIVVLESPVPLDELFIIDLDNDVLKIDGNMAIAWSGGLKFTVERTTKTLIGSAASQEGLVNVYRGTGRVLVAPVACNYNITIPTPVGL
ncbi:MAG: AIM24 family protein [Clostridia bacterium]|nr:AIM24 family protein [Clostridia bacterium]